MSKVKGKKAKEKLKHQAQEKKEVAAKHKMDIASTSQTTLGGSQYLGVKKSVRR